MVDGFTTLRSPIWSMPPVTSNVAEHDNASFLFKGKGDKLHTN